MDQVIPTCSICLISLAAFDEPTRLKNCGHAYHKDCVKSWLIKNAQCPECRVAVTSEHDLQRDFVLASIIESLKSLNVSFESPSIPSSSPSPSIPSSTTPPSTPSPISANNNNNNNQTRNTSPDTVNNNTNPQTKYTAFHVHPLTMVYEPKTVYPPSGQWFCDICGAAATPASIMHHCYVCGTFDMCNSCMVKSAACNSLTSPRHNHPVTLSDPGLIYSKFRGKWHCNLCRKNNQPEMYHCYTCQDFDMCGGCK